MAINRSKNERTRVVPPDEFSLQGTGSGTLDAAIEIAQELHGWIAKMKEALLSGDDVQLKLYARKLCGLSADDAPRQPRAKLKGGSKYGKK